MEIYQENLPIGTAAPIAPVPALDQKSGATTGQVVASKKGKKYHLPWCAGAKAIAAANKVTFASAEEARAAGYTPAANCPGLK
ncbi:MAG: hypothetical protein AAB468_01620 [Patescibacteria group bacterium]